MTSEPPSRNASKNIVWHHGEVDAGARRAAFGHAGATLWFTGLSGSGKSTVAVAVEKALTDRSVRAYRLDGDNVRHGLNGDLGFSAADREENVRRVGEVSRLLADAGVLCLSSFISPYRRDRERVRAMHADAGLVFLEVFVDTPIEVCEGRDPKGLYKKARAGEIKGFTGIDDPYEAPASPEIRLTTATMSVDESAAECLQVLAEAGVIDRG
ncbi:MAG: adenylyl-sulfate kinase [Planctomycetota bacterium]